MAESKVNAVDVGGILLDIPDNIGVSFLPNNKNLSTKCLEKGLNYFTQGYIHNIRVFKLESRVQVSAKCWRSMRKNDSPHSLHIEISIAGDERITESYCSCKAGLSGTCSHVVGLVKSLQGFKLHNFRSVPDQQSCTSIPQQWHVPRGNKISPVPINHVVVARPTEERKRRPLTSQIDSQTKIPKVSSTDLTHLQGLKGTPLEYMVSGEAPKYISPLGEVQLGSLLSYQQEQQQEGVEEIKQTEHLTGETTQRRDSNRFPAGDLNMDRFSARDSNMSNIFSARADGVEKACADPNLAKIMDPFPSQHLNHIIVNDNKKIMFCYIPKIACTNFLRVFLTLESDHDPSYVNNITGYDAHFTSKNQLKFLGEFNKIDQLFRLKYYKKVLFVRDPLERLLSAYRNKFVTHPNPRERKKWLLQVSQFYNEFKRRASERNFKNDYVKDKLTFNQFLYYVMDHHELKGQINEHFASYVNLCYPCDVHYDYIGVYENLREEAEYIFKEFSIDIVFPKRQDNYTGPKTSDITWSYFKDVPSDVTQSIFEIYKQDYMIFNIPIPEWFLKINIE